MATEGVGIRKSRLRGLIEIQRAHDLLGGIVLRPDMFEQIELPVRPILVASLDALCWCLSHNEEDDNFPKLLETMEEWLREEGYELVEEEEGAG